MSKEHPTPAELSQRMQILVDKGYFVSTGTGKYKLSDVSQRHAIFGLVTFLGWKKYPALTDCSLPEPIFNDILSNMKAQGLIKDSDKGISFFMTQSGYISYGKTLMQNYDTVKPELEKAVW